MPFSRRSGFDDHHRGILPPPVPEGEEARIEEAFREVGRRKPFLSFGGKIPDLGIVGEEFRPSLVSGNIPFPAAPLGIAEARIRIIGEAEVHVEHNHRLNGVRVALRELRPETVHVRHTQCLAEDVDARRVVMQVQFVLPSVRIDLLLDFTVQDIDATLAPSCSFLKFGKESPCIEHPLRLEKQVVAFCRIVAHHVQGMAVVIA